MNGAHLHTCIRAHLDAGLGSSPAAAGDNGERTCDINKHAADGDDAGDEGGGDDGELLSSPFSFMLRVRESVRVSHGPRCSHSAACC